MSNTRKSCCLADDRFFVEDGDRERSLSLISTLHRDANNDGAARFFLKIDSRVRLGVGLHLRRLPVPAAVPVRRPTFTSSSSKFLPFLAMLPPTYTPSPPLLRSFHSTERVALERSRGSKKQSSRSRVVLRCATMVKPEGKKTKGKQVIEIRRIENKERRQVTFSKRKAGVLKKASELSLLCGAHAAVVIFSKKQELPQGGGEAGRASGGGNVLAMGTPSVDHVLRRFAPLPGDAYLPALEDVGGAAERATVEATVRQTEETKARVAAEAARMSAIGAMVLTAVPAGRERFWWEADVEALGEAELPEFARALQRLRDYVRRHAGKLQPSAAPAGTDGAGQPQASLNV
ncbi:hypothetical protein PAHAL_4G157400 [Panicum hallii]|jgi:pheromone receptor transcription factor|uniref:MADS-box domain-containing protein n=2 Tax=Panicum hallii TaxID=206008 RepID=A0A2S3HJB7_9POAL|nr:hypothetical protein PAHAL_4G157400 [Panicum hallii]